jgi:hypothetical protein
LFWRFLLFAAFGLFNVSTEALDYDTHILGSEMFMKDFLQGEREVLTARGNTSAKRGLAIGSHPFFLFCNARTGRRILRRTRLSSS